MFRRVLATAAVLALSPVPGQAVYLCTPSAADDSSIAAALSQKNEITSPQASAAVIGAIAKQTQEERKPTLDALDKRRTELASQIRSLSAIQPQTDATRAQLAQANQELTDKNKLRAVVAGQSQLVTVGVAEAYTDLTHPYFLICGSAWWTPDDPTKWETKLVSIKDKLVAVGRSVGLVMLDGEPIGTAFVVGNADKTGYILTNRHVLEHIVSDKKDWNVKPGATIHFDKEWPLGTSFGCSQPNPERTYTINAVVAFGQADPGLEADDLVVLITEADKDYPPALAQRIARRQPLSYKANMSVAVIGYPEDPNDMTQVEKEQTFRTPTTAVPQFKVKRLNAGYTQYFDVTQQGEFSHDANTTGGNSGSPIVDLSDGAIVGVHFCSFPRSQAAGLPGRNFGITSDRAIRLLVQANLLPNQ